MKGIFLTFFYKIGKLAASGRGDMQDSYLLRVFGRDNTVFGEDK